MIHKATAEQYNRAQELQTKTGHTLGDALDIVMKHDAKRTIGKAHVAKGGGLGDWNPNKIHGIEIEVDDAEALAEVMGYTQQLLKGVNLKASEDQVEREILDYLILKGASTIRQINEFGSYVKGQLIWHKTSQKQKPKGMTAGISDLLITRVDVWPGWYQVEVKPRNEHGKRNKSTKITAEQQRQHDMGLLTFAWHPAHVATLIYSLDKRFGSKAEDV